MNNLAGHINFLLFEYNFVIVPGLGGFVINREQANLDTDKGILHPPHYSIGFNKALTHNDGLLAQLYIKTNSISYHEAEMAIERDVLNMKRELSSQRFIELGNWGVLFMNEEGNICFKTQNSSPFIRPDLFGLKELQMARLDELMASEELSLKGKKRPFRRVLQSAAASAAAALLIFAASVPIYDKQEQSAQYAGFFAGKIASTNEIPAPSIKTSSEVSRNATSAEKDIEKPVHECETPSPQLQPEAIAQKRYYIIVSTFRTTAIAEKELNNFRAKGFSTSGIIEEPRAKRIYVASFAEESGASDFLKKFIENNPNNADAWIYTKKPIAK